MFLFGLQTNDKEKTQAIADAEALITELTSAIEEGTANSARLNTEIKNLEAEIAKNQEALDKATVLRGEGRGGKDGRLGLNGGRLRCVLLWRLFARRSSRSSTRKRRPIGTQRRR